MSEPFLAEIRMVGFNFAPRGYASCDGQILPINQNQSLYSLLGTMYGGDGRNDFALPDLRGRIPFHVGTEDWVDRQGEKSGEENHALTTNEIPSHTHEVKCQSGLGNQLNPLGQFPAKSTVGDLQYATQAGDGDMKEGNATGGGQSHENMPPYLAIHFVIALQGLFPSRS